MQYQINFLSFALLIILGSCHESGTKQIKTVSSVVENEDPNKAGTNVDHPSETQADNFVYVEAYPRNTVLDFENFRLEIANYQVQNEPATLKSFKDTIYLTEWVGSYLQNRVMKIFSKESSAIYQMDYCLNDIIYEQYNEELVDDYDSWVKIRNEWSGFTAYKPLIRLAPDKFKFPNDEWWNYLEDKRKKELDLSDTLVDLSKETDNIATVIYKDKPSIYIVDNVIIRIKQEKNGDEKLKFIKVRLARGC